MVALSRLASTNTGKMPKDYDELDALATVDVQFTAVLVRMDDDFRKRILNRYRKDGWWRQGSKQIDENDALGEDAVTLPFVRGRNLPTTEADPYFSPSPEEEADAEVETT